MNLKVAACGLAVLACGAVGGWTAAELMGPPLICEGVKLVEPLKLPWEGENGTQKSNVEVAKAATELLAKTKDATVRTAIIRSAVLNSMEHPKQAQELLLRTALRALEQQASGKADGSALFDVGYMGACMRIVDLTGPYTVGRAEKAEGYGFIREAIKLSGGDASMEFAASQIVRPFILVDASDTERKAAGELETRHLLRAAAACKAGSNAEANIVPALKGRGLTLEQARASAKKEVADAGHDKAKR